jgi:sulfopropanediol 3-dehydrogenase
MRVVKDGQHRLLERDQETVRIVSEMLGDLERNGMDAVRRYSARFDDWTPASFELSSAEIEQAWPYPLEQVQSEC